MFIERPLLILLGAIFLFAGAAIAILVGLFVIVIIVLGLVDIACKTRYLESMWHATRRWIKSLRKRTSRN